MGSLATLSTVLSTVITRQVVFDGFVAGCTTALVAIGVVLIFRSTRVINFAVGNMGLPATSLMALLSINYGWGFWPALVLSLVVGGAFAAAMELVVVRRLFNAPRVIVLVATIGIAQLAAAIPIAYPDLASRRAVKFPVAIDKTWADVAGIRVTGADLTVIIVVPLLTILLGWFLNRTMLGRTVKASADNPSLARLSGVSPKMVSTFVWITGGLVSSASIIMLSGMAGSPTGIGNLGPNTMNRALAAAVIAGMVSFPRALAAGIGLGVIESLVRFNFINQIGLIDMLLFVAVVVAVVLHTRNEPDEASSFSFAPRVRPIPEHVLRIWWIRHLGKLFAGVVLLGAAVMPLIITEPSRHLLYTQILVFAVAALSLVVVTGWSGQLSLGQMAFAGLGALFAAAAHRGLEMDVGPIAFTAPSVPWAASMLLGALFAALVAVIIGMGALRVRGLLLAISTFAFALAAQSYLYRRPFFSDGNTVSVAYERTSFLGIEIGSERSYYWFCLILMSIVLAGVGHLRRTGIGRSTIAVRDNTDTASAYTVPSARTKLSAFALGGGLAGLAGAMLAGSAQVVPLSERFFQVGDSLRLVAIVVIGGLGSVAGPVLGALWVEGLPAIFPDNEAIPLLTSGMGLLILLLYFPGGLVQVGYSARDALVRYVEARIPADDVSKRTSTAPASISRRSQADGDDDGGQPALQATDITVRFGGNTVLVSVTIEVGRGETIGLIGTNGAGKSTLLNAIGGHLPSEGTVRLEGDDISRRSSAARAELGLGRTFQAAGLFPELTVRETVMVALEGRGHTRFMASALALPASITHERARRTNADELIDFLGLGRYADAYIADLSTGTRRIVELAGLLALDAKVLCLDEPTAGVAQRETEAFGPLILAIRRELGAAMVVIEHDMPLIMSISDRVYCLDLGKVIAEGSPDEVRNDASVVAAYLGTDDRAIDRSDQPSS